MKNAIEAKITGCMTEIRTKKQRVREALQVEEPADTEQPEHVAKLADWASGHASVPDVARIAELLHEAAETHHAVYRMSDGDDPDWASWYADWLLDLSELPGAPRDEARAQPPRACARSSSTASTLRPDLPGAGRTRTRAASSSGSRPRPSRASRGGG